jgi:hypothetical protein
MPEFDWERPLADLHELRELTGGPDGARRLAWSADWRKAREWLLGKLEPLGVEVERDAAGNLWATLGIPLSRCMRAESRSQPYT